MDLVSFTLLANGVFLCHLDFWNVCAYLVLQNDLEYTKSLCY